MRAREERVSTEPIVQVRRMDVRRQTDEEEHLRIDRYRVEELTGDPMVDHQLTALVEVMGRGVNRMCWCLKCRSRAMLELPCRHIEAARTYVHTRVEE